MSRRNSTGFWLRLLVHSNILHYWSLQSDCTGQIANRWRKVSISYSPPAYFISHITKTNATILCSWNLIYGGMSRNNSLGIRAGGKKAQMLSRIDRICVFYYTLPKLFLSREGYYNLIVQPKPTSSNSCHWLGHLLATFPFLEFFLWSRRDLVGSVLAF